MASSLYLLAFHRCMAGMRGRLTACLHLRGPLGKRTEKILKGRRRQGAARRQAVTTASISVVTGVPALTPQHLYHALRAASRRPTTCPFARLMACRAHALHAYFSLTPPAALCPLATPPSSKLASALISSVYSAYILMYIIQTVCYLFLIWPGAHHFIAAYFQASVRSVLCERRLFSDRPLTS